VKYNTNKNTGNCRIHRVTSSK